MNNTKTSRYIKCGIVIILAVLLLFGGKALAQLFAPATEPGGKVIVQAPSYISGDPAYQNILPPDENPTSGVNNSAKVFSYYQVTGATLRSRSSSTEFSYDGKGCSHTISNSGDHNLLNTELIIPDHAVIKYLRVYYNDTNPASGVDGYITKIQPGVVVTDLISTGSTDAFAGGFGFSVSAEITETVDNTNFAYTLIGWPDENNVANQICGLRVAYYAPFRGIIFMPVVHR
jgi:hypothetical protein